MIKKHRNLLKGITFSIVILAIIAIIGEAYGLYDPKGNQFLTDDASTILGQNFYMAGNWWNDTYYNKHQMDCWAHNVKEPLEAGGVNNHIHSVYDIDFDETKGVMKVYSIIEDNNKTSKTTYADGTNVTLGRLAYEASKSGNIEKVYRAIGQAINAGVVVNEQVITSFSNEWNVKFDDNQDQLYNNYKSLKSLQDKVQETSETVSINDEDYTVIGHFKLNFSGLGIESIKIGNANWSDSTQYKEIYWRYADTNKPQNWHSNFNEAKSGKYELDGNSFDLAVKTSSLPNDGNYKIKINQKEFKYYKSRIVVTAGRKLQQFGMYAYDNTPKTYVASEEWNITRIPTDKNLIIAKKDKKSGEKITGAGFKLYAVLKDGTKGWVSGSVDAEKKYESNVTNATEYSDDVEIKTLKLGEYYVFETKAPEGYDLKTQENYNKAKEGIPTPTGEWVYVGSQLLNTKSSKTVTYDVTNTKPVLGTTKIIKIDADTEQEITGGEFKIYAVIDNETKGWVAGDVNGAKTYEQDATKATTYASNVNIEKLKAGTYYYFETKAPEGYNMKKQAGYGKTDKDIANVKPSDSEWVYLGSKVIPKDLEETQVYDFTAINSKTVDKIEGTVWQDNLDTKANKTDSIYNDKSNDVPLEGIEVALYDNNGKAIATTTTDKNGYYCFTEKDAGEDKNLYYSEITQGYVEFAYDNYKYLCVDALAGDDVKVNSKALERTITTDKLDDNNIPSNQGKGTYQGKAVTDKTKTPLTAYYDNKTYTISNINLGLMEKLDPEFSITEDVAYMKVKFGDYVYKYEYMKDSDQLKRTTVPTVNQQVSARTFTAKIYPSDVAYNKETGTETLKVYMVYRINVFNNTSHNIDNNYKEAKMYVESLANSYDSNKYILNSKDIDSVDIEEASKDFGLWQESGVDENGNALASYNCSDTWRNYKAGVKTEFNEEGKIIEGKEGYVTSYIQFQLTESSVNKILEKALKEEDLETAPSVATAKTFHEYWRKDQVWEESKDRYYEGNILEDAEMSKSYYLHKSKYQTASSADLWMKFGLPEKERTLSGVVFEDKVKDNDTKLGNGKKDDTENTVSKVTVDLMKSPNEIATLYPLTIKNGKYTYDGEKPATVEVEEGGTFEFKGVIPGIYYIRFTYGNGEQRLYDMNGHIVKVKDANGNDTNEDVKVTLNDYKSTIIDVANSEDAKIIKDAIENGTNLEWYKDLKEAVYSTAIDDMSQRQMANSYVYYADGTVHKEDGSLVEEEILKSINSYTPRISVTIENDKETSSNMLDNYSVSQDEKGNVVEDIKQIEESPYYEFKGFNFGIIKAPDTTIKTEKTISNIKLTDQTGATIVSADPKDKNAKYVTALDGVGSNVKAEIEENLLYGSEVEVTYNITLTNDSDIDYIENDEEHLGDWYNYGIKTEGVTVPKSITIKEVEDILNEKYNSDTVKLVSYTVNETSEEPSKITIEKLAGEKTTQIDTTTIEEDGTETTKTKMLITGWSDQMKREDTQTIEYTVSALLSSDNEDEEGYTNDARVTKIKLDKLTPLTSGSEWSKVDETVVSITPPTGQDKTSTYYIAGVIALIALASGIIIIKKRVLK